VTLLLEGRPLCTRVLRTLFECQRAIDKILESRNMIDDAFSVQIVFDPAFANVECYTRGNVAVIVFTHKAVYSTVAMVEQADVFGYAFKIGL
jgi:hypothetical protein